MKNGNRLLDHLRLGTCVYSRGSLAIREKALGPDHPHVATSLNNLALLYDTQGDYARAEPLYKRSLAIREKALGPDHPLVATSLENLAAVFRATKRPAEAENLEARAKKSGRSNFDNDGYHL